MWVEVSVVSNPGKGKVGGDHMMARALLESAKLLKWKKVETLGFGWYHICSGGCNQNKI